MRALFVLNPNESKRLIGKAVASMEEVKKAKEHDRLLIAHGSTSVFVAEEVLGRDRLAGLIDRNTYLSGVIKDGFLCCTSQQEKPPFLLLNRGVVEPPAPTMAEILRDFGEDSVFIKGANAVDADYNAAVLVGNPEGGTIGYAIGILLARGIHVIVPVGLEKLIPSVKQAVLACGQLRLDYCQGMKTGMIPVSGAKVVTEIQALTILAGVETFHVASGGCGVSQGAVTLVCEGDEEAVKKAIGIVEAIKGEPPLDVKRSPCVKCGPFLSGPGGAKACEYQGRAQEDVPAYLRDR